MRTNEMRLIKRLHVSALLAFVAVALVATESRAQETDGRWLPFAGCWEPVGESTALDAPDARVCFGGVDGNSGVEMISIEDGVIAARDVFGADGVWRTADSEGCTGRDFATFSTTPGRVFTQSEHTCEGGVERRSSGIMTFVTPRQWIDVRVVSTGDESFAWFTRYRLAPSPETAEVSDITADRDMAVNAARVAAVARPSIDDLIEASDYVDPEGVKTWLAERDTWLESLEAADLLALAEAGVPEDVIDMAIAVSYPERFAIARDDERRYGGLAAYDPIYDPFYGPFGGRYYSPYRYGYGYGYGFGLGYGGRYRGPIIVTVDRDDDRSGGRVISGQGYTRGQASGGSSRSTGRSGTVTSSGRSSGSSIGRSTGGSSGRSTGRTARRRGGS